MFHFFGSEFTLSRAGAVAIFSLSIAVFSGLHVRSLSSFGMEFVIARLLAIFIHVGLHFLGTPFRVIAFECLFALVSSASTLLCERSAREPVSIPA